MVTAYDWEWVDLEEKRGKMTWWMREDVMRSIMSGDDGTWQAYLWRMNNWERVKHDKVFVRDAVEDVGWTDISDEPEHNVCGYPLQRFMESTEADS